MCISGTSVGTSVGTEHGDDWGGLLDGPRGNAGTLPNWQASFQEQAVHDTDQFMRALNSLELD